MLQKMIQTHIGRPCSDFHADTSNDRMHIFMISTTKMKEKKNNFQYSQKHACSKLNRTHIQVHRHKKCIFLADHTSKCKGSCKMDLNPEVEYSKSNK